MSERNFPLGDILSITTEKLLSPRQIEGVYDVLNFMTGADLFTHQLPRARLAVLPEILRQHPELAGIDVSDVTPENWKERLAALVQQHGQFLALTPAPAGVYAPQNPLTELANMTTRSESDADGTPIIVVGFNA